MLKNMTGERFGRLVVISRVEKPAHLKPTTHAFWLCHCDCGNETIVKGESLRVGDTNSCGCLISETVSETQKYDLVGHKFGQLTVIKATQNRSKKRNVIWECLCDCGETTLVPTDRLTQGNTQSCGCTKFIRWHNISFRSLFEVMVAIALDVKGIRWEYETLPIPVTIDGIDRKYLPDFLLPDNGVIVEVKGWHKRMNVGMEKLRQAINKRYRIQTFLLRDVEQLAGCSYSRVRRAFSTGGLVALENLIRSSCQTDETSLPVLSGYLI